MTVQMDETFAAALRELLVTDVEAADRPGRRAIRTRQWLSRAGAVLAVAAGGAGIAYATGAFSVPGSDVTIPLATPVPVMGSGRQTVYLGRRPTGATAVTIDLTCLTAGTFVFPDGASEVCDRPGNGPATESVPLTPGQDTITITATPGARWRLVATYSSVTTSSWGINASGQTYGAPNRRGTPDLVAVIATNGRAGYVYANQLEPPMPSTPSQAVAQDHAPARTVPVYESDGKTPIGTFTANNPGPSATSARAPAATTSPATSTRTTP